MVQLRYLIFNWYNPKQFVFKKVSNKNWNCIFDSFRTGIDTFSEMLSFVAKYVLFLQKKVWFLGKKFQNFLSKTKFFQNCHSVKKTLIAKRLLRLFISILSKYGCINCVILWLYSFPNLPRHSAIAKAFDEENLYFL